VASNGPVARVKEPAPVPPPAATGVNSLAGLIGVFGKASAWQRVIGWDDFTHRMVFRREPPFRNPVARLGHPVGEEDIVRMRHWFEVEMGVKLSGKLVMDALQLVSRQHRFHPVADYLTSLSWDGVSRVETWLEDFCSVQPTSPDHQRLIRAVARKWLISCVARAMNPGCKVDTMLILEGKQGIGKSSILRELAGERFFCDAHIEFGKKDACQTIQGVWIYELPELDALLRGDSASTKAFLSRPTDKFRAPYARAPISVARSLVFCGTVNHSGYLKDPSGSRRFWVVKCGETINVQGIRTSRDQLWAEARALFESGEPWHLSTEEESLMRQEHEERMEPEPWEEAIAAWLAGQSERPIGIEEVLEHALGMKAAARNPNVTRRVHDILVRLGFERQRKAFENPGRRVYRYVRMVTETCPPASLPYCPPVDDRVSSSAPDE
jgi:putative DNA primase/helicase